MAKTKKYDRDDCIESLNGIHDTLTLMAQAADKYWAPADRRWIEPGKTPNTDLFYDLTRVFDAFFDDLRRALRWIEFHVGLDRRDRFAKILVTLQQKIKNIEHGDSSDPFLWTRESIDAAASEAAVEIRHVAEHVAELLALIEKASGPVPLTDVQQQVYDYIKAHGPVLGKTICGELQMDQSSLTRHIIPALKEKRGIRNQKDAGYYIPDANTL